MKQVVNLTP